MLVAGIKQFHERRDVTVIAMTHGLYVISAPVGAAA